MGNNIVVLLLSVIVLLGALYVHKVEQNIVQIKDELLQHGNEIKEVKEELKFTNKALTQVKVELESTNKALTQMKVELESTRKELTQVKVEFESTKKEVKQVQVELDSTRDELKQLKVELESTNKEVKQMKVELNKIKKEFHTQRPGFYVTLSSHTNLHQTQRIEFDQVITDVTNNYNKLTGIFTVPKNGLYHFSFTMFSNGGNLYAEIMQNHLSIGLNYGHSDCVSAAINVVISCKQGDSIFVRHMPGRGTQTIHGGGYSAFSGFLIY